MSEVRISAETLAETFPVFISGEAAARLMGVSYPTFKKMALAGDVTATMKNDRWVVNTRSVFSYLGIETKVVMHND